MKQNYFVAPIVLRYLFFVMNFYFTIRIVSVLGWSFLAFLLAVFATRDLVHAVRLTQIYLQIKKHKDSKK